jgi:hypothetical protein
MRLFLPRRSCEPESLTQIRILTLSMGNGKDPKTKRNDSYLLFFFLFIATLVAKKTVSNILLFSHTFNRKIRVTERAGAFPTYAA